MPTAHAQPTIAILTGLALLGLTQFAAAASPDAAPQGGPAPAPDVAAANAPAEAEAAPESWAIHGQATNLWQYHPAFTSTVGASIGEAAM